MSYPHEAADQAGRLLAKVAASNWRDFVSDEEGAEYDRLVGRHKQRALTMAAIGGAAGGGIGHMVKDNPMARRLGVGPAVGALLGASMGLQANKVQSQEDISQARKIMMRGGRARGAAKRQAWLDKELAKNAASRQAKELAKGNISYNDLDARLPTKPGFFEGDTKRRLRSLQTAPAEVAPSALSRRRALSEASTRNLLNTGGAGTGIEISPSMLPGGGLMTTFDGTVHSSTGAGQFVRGATSKNPITKFRAGVGTAVPELLPSKKEVDKTLNRAILQHEMGEAIGMRGKKIQPHASHIGVEPILREQLYSMGDPEAIREMGRLRQMHPDDAFVQKAIRQVGGTPDAPIAIGSKKHKALERVLARRGGEKLHKTTGPRSGQISRAVEKELDYAHRPSSQNTAGRALQRGWGRLRNDPTLQRKAGLGALGIAGLAAGAYGAKKLYDAKKKRDQEQ